MSESFEFYTQPFKHQREVFDRTKDLAAYALFWEQGCGKTKPTLDTAVHLYLKGEIDTLVVVAPSGVHRNWVTDEIPTHVSPEIRRTAFIDYWDSPKSRNKGHQRKMTAASLWDKGLVVITVSYDGFMTKHALKYFGQLFRKRKVMFVVDEAHLIKNPQAKRTKTIVKAGTYAPYRRLLTGTPVAQGPFDLFSQVKFLDQFFWKERRFSTYTAFKQYFGVFVTQRLGQRQFQQLVKYRNLDELSGILKLVGDRLTKEEALDLPPKIYSKRRFELEPEQRALYDELREQLFLDLDGRMVEAPLAITMLLRLQQLTSGYATDTEGQLVTLGANPRLDLLQDIAEGLYRPAIVWARFTQDINLIIDRLEAIGKTCVRYDGQVDDDERSRNKAAFQTGEIDFFVGNPAAGSTGLTLTQAKTVIYYTNSFRLIDRLQSEDRPHRIGQDDKVDYIDLIGQGTVDERIVDRLREKFDISSLLTGDELRSWI